jgi:membrane protease YdiL (CAAX protease family)
VTVEPVAPGTPYHRLGRNTRHRWWRPLVGTLLIAAITIQATVMLTAWVVVLALSLGADVDLYSETAEIFGHQPADLALWLGTLAIITPIVLFGAWLVQHRPAGSVSSVTGGLRYRWLLVTAGLAVPAIVAGQLVASRLLPESEPFHLAGWREVLPPLVVIVLLVPFQAAAEEYFFRGWLLQAIGTPWLGVPVSAALFTAAHAYSGWAVLDVFCFGIVAALLTIRTGGLEAAIGLHLVNNLAAFGLPSLAGELDEVLRVTDEPWQAFTGSLVQVGVYAVLVLFAARRARIATRATPSTDRQDGAL